MNNVQIAAKLYECRDTAKAFFGEKYQEKLQPYTHILKEVMKANNLEEIPAFLKISKTQHCAENGMAQMMYMAAVVELIEPSQEVTKQNKKTTMSATESTSTHIEVIEIADNILFIFAYIPKDYRFKKFELEGFDSCYVGRLNSFNRLKCLSPFRKDRDLKELFTTALKKKGWDFEEFPNPIAFAAIKHDNQQTTNQPQL